MNEAQYPIRLVARLTGLSAHVIRIWEQRYRAVVRLPAVENGAHGFIASRTCSAVFGPLTTRTCPLLNSTTSAGIPAFVAS